MAQAKPACGSHPHDCNADVLSIQYMIMTCAEYGPEINEIWALKKTKFKKII